jgi:hypothetical protein
MQLGKNSNTNFLNRQKFSPSRINRFFNPRISCKKRVSLTDGLSPAECESANVNTDALNSVTGLNNPISLSDLSAMYRKKIALQARVNLSTGGIIPSIFFNS